MTRIVITGATGNVGRAALHAIDATDAHVTAVARHPDPAGRTDVEWVAADVEADGLTGLLRADDHVLLYPIGDPRRVADAVATAGVGHVVLLSSVGAHTRPDQYPDAASWERAISRSGLDWTMLRPGGFMTNAFAWADSVRGGGPAAAPYVDVALPVVAPDDVGAVAAQILLHPASHVGRSYTLTGPAAISPREQVAELSAALGRPVPLLELDRDAAFAALAATMPIPVVEATLAVLGEPSAAEQAVSDDVEQVLGRRALDWRAWVERNLTAFAGS